ncbi:MAG: acyl carrier protein [Chloroflexi bacterium]|nr:acyl carrier protein [Chloroflexota bacterium]MBM3153763.1 acyl carrier protein [Chloroflexota bacterium]MBM3173047.1 acyl carrier protein [Chloroflexota bacterium]MBM3174157.1 acyl carrier protein [Chloroflexota bacterium]MBM4449225.1 acyl carrier protein [Chloroflexota bacterium]
MMATILQRLKKVISEQLGVDEDPIEPSASFVEDLNVDPEDLAELITAVEEQFSTRDRKLEIADEDIEEIVTVQDLIDCLHDYGIED